MGKPNNRHGKPPFFRQCPTCHLEFGSRSLRIHLPRCQEKYKKSFDADSSSSSDNNTPAPALAPNDAAAKILVNVAKKAAAAAAAAANVAKPKSKGKMKSSSTTSDDEDVETSLSDELSQSWPSPKKTAAAGTSDHHQKQVVRRSRRTRRDIRKQRLERPKTATLPRPKVLDESLKDKLDMTLTKKELLAAVKLCSDAAVQRGLPHMRPVRPRNFIAKNRGGAKHTPLKTSSSSSDSVSPYTTSSTPLNKKFFRVPKPPRKPVVTDTPRKPPGSSSTVEHLPRIVPTVKQISTTPSHPISNKLSKRMKIKSKDQKTSSPVVETAAAAAPAVVRPRTVIDPDVINANIQKTMSEIKLFKRVPNRSNNFKLGPAAAVTLPAAAAKSAAVVPQPCMSCGRDDLPERLHTHHVPKEEGENHKNEKKEKKPWVSPEASRKQRNKRSQSCEDNVSPSRRNAVGGASTPCPTTTTSTRLQPRRPASTTTIIRVEELTDDNDDSGISISEAVPIVDVKAVRSPIKDEQVSLDSVIEDKAVEGPKDEEGKKKPEENKERPRSSSTSPTQATKDNLVKCETCGKLFNRNSFRFHVPQCEKKEKARKLKEEQDKLKEMRNSSYIIYDEYEPDKFIVPSLLDSDENRKPLGENEHFQQAFDAVWEAHVQQLIPCKSCGRTFFPDRIRVHQKSCKGDQNNKKKNRTNMQTPPAVGAAHKLAATEAQLSLLKSPLPVKRQLHSQQDSVVVVKSKSKEESDDQPTSI